MNCSEIAPDLKRTTIETDLDLLGNSLKLHELLLIPETTLEIGWSSPVLNRTKDGFD